MPAPTSSFSDGLSDDASAKSDNTDNASETGSNLGDSVPIRSALRKKNKNGDPSAPPKRKKRAMFASDSDAETDTASNFSNADDDASSAANSGRGDQQSVSGLSSNAGDDKQSNTGSAAVDMRSSSQGSSSGGDTQSFKSEEYRARREEFLARERAMNKAALEKKGGESGPRSGIISSTGRHVPARYLSARISNWCASLVPDCLSSVSPTTMMILLFLIPVIFLVVYTAIPLASSIASVNYLQNHVDVIRNILSAAARAQEERRDSSLFLATTTNTTNETAAIETLTATRVQVDSFLSRVLTTVVGSDSEFAGQVLSDTQSIISKISTERRGIDTRTTTGVEMRRNLLIAVEDVYALVLLLAKDSRCAPLELRFTVFIILGRIQNSLGLLRAIGVAILNRDGSDQENTRQMYSVRESVLRDIIMVLHNGHETARQHVVQWYEQPIFTDFEALADKLQTGNAAQIASVNLTSWLGTANRLLLFLEDLDKEVLDHLVEGQSLIDDAIAEGMKMLGAVVACVLGGIFVIWFNNREQEKLEHALSNTRVLARAVQRFVPKNQLRSMGVRSIIEVHPGMSTEVATVLLTAGIRNFSDLSRTMNNTELFDWIQKYMSRMTNVTQNNSGFIDKVVADTAYAVFSVSKNAVQSAIAMQVVTDQLNSVLVAQGHDHHVTIGIGIHLCPVVTGVYGDSSRLSVAMVSSDVMLSSRLEAMSKSFGAKILASDAVISQIVVAKSPHDVKSTREAVRKRREKAERRRAAKKRAEEFAKSDSGQTPGNLNNNNNTNNRTDDSNSSPESSLESDISDTDDREQASTGTGSSAKKGFQLRLVGTVRRIVYNDSSTGGSLRMSSDASSSNAGHSSKRSRSDPNRVGVYDETRHERDKTNATLSDSSTSISSGSNAASPKTRLTNSAVMAVQKSSTSPSASRSPSKRNVKEKDRESKNSTIDSSEGTSVATIDIYDIFQADDLAMKNFKVMTKFAFESAIKRILKKSTDLKPSEEILKKLYKKSKRWRVRDIAVERTLTALKRDKANAQNALVIGEDAERDGVVQDMMAGRVFDSKYDSRAGVSLNVSSTNSESEGNLSSSQRSNTPRSRTTTKQQQEQQEAERYKYRNERHRSSPHRAPPAPVQYESSSSASSGQSKRSDDESNRMISGKMTDNDGEKPRLPSSRSISSINKRGSPLNSSNSTKNKKRRVLDPQNMVQQGNSNRLENDDDDDDQNDHTALPSLYVSEEEKTTSSKKSKRSDDGTSGSTNIADAASSVSTQKPLSGGSSNDGTATPGGDDNMSVNSSHKSANDNNDNDASVHGDYDGINQDNGDINNEKSTKTNGHEANDEKAKERGGDMYEDSVTPHLITGEN